jgi:hypothetical protein
VFTDVSKARTDLSSGYKSKQKVKIWDRYRKVNYKDTFRFNYRENRK